MTSRIEVLVPIPRRLAPRFAQPLPHRRRRDLRLVIAMSLVGAVAWFGLLLLVVL